MKQVIKFSLLLIALIFVTTSCELVRTSENSGDTYSTNTAGQEQAATEKNQQTLLKNQPPPRVTWSMERDALDMRFKMMNNRGIVFYMYVFNYGIADPIGFYQVNKVSSVNSQLTNPNQIVISKKYDTPGEYSAQTAHVLPSPAEDGSYGTNGDGVFSFTPDQIYLEHNMQYMVSSVPLTFNSPVNRLVQIDVKDLEEYQKLLDKLN